MNTIFNIESEEDFLSTSEKVVRNLYKTSTCYNENAAKEELKKLISSNKYQINNVANHLKGQEFPVDRLKKFLHLMNQYKNEILHSALIDYNTDFGTCITDFDWNVKYILGTNSLKSARYSLLQMHFTTADAAKGTKSTVYELSKDSLCTLINSLEDVIK